MPVRPGLRAVVQHRVRLARAAAARRRAPRTARDFGLGRTVKLPPRSPRPGPARRRPVERAAAMIGQARILASPLPMAGVAATVADGRWRAPRLVDTDPRAHGPALSATRRRTLRDAHAQRGHARAPARRSPACPASVAGKTGTAEFGAGDPPPDARVVHRVPRRPRVRGARRARPLGRLGRRADRPALLHRARGRGA